MKNDFLNGVRIALAPMAGVADLAFRTVCREFGAQYTVTEMVSAKALVFQDSKSRRLLELADGEHPSAAQIFGSEPDVMAKAAVLAAEISGADAIDINMGCPMGKIVSNRDGSALMRDLPLAEKIVNAVVAEIPVPVTVKMRIGWDSGSKNCVELAKICEQAGVSAVTVHGRTRTQMYSGVADHDMIRAVKQAVSIPVIANGDAFDAESAARILRYTGADAVMVGRASFGRPWIFREISAKLNGDDIPPPPSVAERCDIAIRHFEIAREQKGERVACLEARKHYAWYLKGIPHAAYYREHVTKIATFDDIYRLTKGIKRDLTLEGTTERE